MIAEVVHRGNHEDTFLRVAGRLVQAWANDCKMWMSLKVIMGAPCNINDLPDGLQATRKEIVDMLEDSVGKSQSIGTW